jgi:hypothetical protein
MLDRRLCGSHILPGRYDEERESLVLAGIELLSL